jgi:hypothetical protein
MNGSGSGWESRLSAWAHSRHDIKALVQFGSRVQVGAVVDSWSDYDYQIITSLPRDYLDGTFTSDLGACWASSAQLSFGNSIKITGVFEGGLEADFVVLKHLDVVVATSALRWPSMARLWPRVLGKGIIDLRIVIGPGWKVIKGGDAWEKRYSRIADFRAALTEVDFNILCDEFWVQLVWAAKKAARGEFRASQRAIHGHLIENSLRMFQEEALLEGRKAFPLGRRAEAWLTPGQIGATAVGTRPDAASLGTSLAQLLEIFAASSARVAELKRWTMHDRGDVQKWVAGIIGPLNG